MIEDTHVCKDPKNCLHTPPHTRIHARDRIKVKNVSEGWILDGEVSLYGTVAGWQVVNMAQGIVREFFQLLEHTPALKPPPEEPAAAGSRVFVYKNNQLHRIYAKANMVHNKNAWVRLYTANVPLYEADRFSWDYIGSMFHDPRYRIEIKEA